MPALNTNETDGGTPAFASQNITVKTSADYSSLTLTMIPSGVYLISIKGWWFLQYRKGRFLCIR